MSTVSPVQQSEVRAAIARASAATGVDFDYLLAQAKIESDFDPAARAGTSSAAGLYQFVNGTWLDTLDKHGATHGMGWAGDAISRVGGQARITDPALRGQIMALRMDPNASALMAAELARDNTEELRGVLGRAPDSAELYLAHFMGAAGARGFLGALQSDPSRSAAGLFPQAASANRPIFYDNGRARSVGEVMDLIRTKVSSAMQGGAGGWGAYSPATAYHMARSSGASALQQAPQGPASRPSMADTLRATFGGASAASDTASAADRVNAAYSKFKAFGL